MRSILQALRWCRQSITLMGTLSGLSSMVTLVLLGRILARPHQSETFGHLDYILPLVGAALCVFFTLQGIRAIDRSQRPSQADTTAEKVAPIPLSETDSYQGSLVTLIIWSFASTIATFLFFIAVRQPLLGFSDYLFAGLTFLIAAYTLGNTAREGMTRATPKLLRLWVALSTAPKKQP